ncbi:TPA: phosphodiester glycosidase family protein [Legionella anisa]
MQIILLLFAWTLVCSPVLSQEKPLILIEQKDLKHHLGIYRHIQFQLPTQLIVHAVILNKSYRAHLYQQAAKKQSSAKSIQDIHQQKNTVVTVNGGFYTTHFHPAGLFIQNGHIFQTGSKESLLNTCIRINHRNQIVLEKNLSRCLRASNAMQTGPLIIEGGNISPTLKSLQQQFQILQAYFEPHRRTLLAQSKNKKLAVIITTPITLLEIAKLIQHHPQLFGLKDIETVLNLDGGPSTGMYVNFEGHTPFYFKEIKSVKTLLLFSN